MPKNIFDTTGSPLNYSRMRRREPHLHHLGWKDGEIVWICKCRPDKHIEKKAKQAFTKYVS